MAKKTAVPSPTRIDRIVQLIGDEAETIKSSDRVVALYVVQQIVNRRIMDIMEQIRAEERERNR